MYVQSPPIIKSPIAGRAPRHGELCHFLLQRRRHLCRLVLHALGRALHRGLGLGQVPALFRPIFRESMVHELLDRLVHQARPAIVGPYRIRGFEPTAVAIFVVAETVV